MEFEVGVGFDSPIAPTVLITVDQRLLPLIVVKDGFIATVGVFFESLNCSGPPFMPAYSPSFIRGLVDNAAIGPPGSTAYQPDLNVSPQTITYRSSVGVTPPQACTQVLSGASLLAVPAVAVIDLRSRYTPPFSYK